MNLNTYVWSRHHRVSDKLNYLMNWQNRILGQVTNKNKIIFDINYEFSTDLEHETINNQWKEIELARKVIVFTKRWDYKYNLDVHRKLPKSVFRNFFKNDLILTRARINYNKQNFYSIKTFLNWADKLVRMQLITNEKYNMFLYELENNNLEN